jgi:uncharacterized protein DUF4190
MAPPAAATSGKAVVALVLGIAGFFVCPIVSSLAAVLVGRSARDEIDADPRLGGRGVAQAGLVLGVVGLMLWVLGIIAYVALIAAAVNS